MDSETHKEIEQTIRKYYNVGIGETDQAYSNIRKIIGSKIDGESVEVKKWSQFVSRLRLISNLQVEDRLFIQFPNLFLQLQEKDVSGAIIIRKNFSLCLSLLCPFYTYYYEYQHQVPFEKGRLFSFQPLVFQATAKYDAFKANVNLNVVMGLLQEHLPEYRFISHFPLMLNQMNEGTPYGIEATMSNSSYSYYQYLFNNDQPAQVDL